MKKATMRMAQLKFIRSSSQTPCSLAETGSICFLYDTVSQRKNREIGEREGPHQAGVHLAVALS